MTPAEQLTASLQRFPPGVARLAAQLFRAMNRRLPGATRLVYDKANALIVGYGPSDRASDAVFSFGVYSRWVNLYFLDGAALQDDAGLLQGGGSRVRFLRLESADDLAAPAVSTLIQRALDAADVPIPDRPRGRLLVRRAATPPRTRGRA